MAGSLGRRIFGTIILVACLGVLGGGAWYFFLRDLVSSWLSSSSDDANDDDQEPDELVIDRDGGAHRVRHSIIHVSRKKGGHKGNGHRAPAPPAAGAPGGAGPGGKSYEAAVRGNHEELSIGGANGAPDLTDLQLAGPMRNGTFLGACGAPDSMHVTVKVAIRSGRAVGVSVYTTPSSPPIASCIDRSVRNLAWPVNAKMDSFVTTY